MSTPPPPHCHDAGARLEDGHAVVHVRAGLAVGEAVEEAAEAQPLGLLLLLALRVLEVAKVCAARAMSGQAGLRPLGARLAAACPTGASPARCKPLVASSCAIAAPQRIAPTVTHRMPCTGDIACHTGNRGTNACVAPRSRTGSCPPSPPRARALTRPCHLPSTLPPSVMGLGPSSGAPHGAYTPW